MEVRIVKKEAFQVIGRTIQTTMKNDEHVKVIGMFWEQCKKDETIKRLLSIAKQGDKGQTGGCLLGIARAETADRDFPFVIGVENTVGDTVGIGMNESGFDTFTVPAYDWAVFGTEKASFGNLGALWKQIFTDFFPSPDFVQILGDELEVFYDADTGNDELRSEIWIPVRPIGS